ncbi:hypothetical protein E6H23_08200 [Candidatus Bathyarchaeota archaeon]|nr:MAG: hypothetical protein E6H23_08200 [Candidatus Bathyarchaeota archaeon]
MTAPANLETVLAGAEEHAGRYDWKQALETYDNFLHSSVDECSIERARILESSAYAMFKWGLQASNQDIFRDNVQRAVERYRRAQISYTTLGFKGQALRCEAMLSHLKYWLAIDPEERKKHLDESWTLATLALQSLEDSSEAREYGVTYNQLSQNAGLLVAMEPDARIREATLRKAHELAEKTVGFLAKIGNSADLARAYIKAAAFLSALATLFTDDETGERYFRQARDYWKQAQGISEETALLELTSFVPVEGIQFTDWEIATVLSNLKKTLAYAEPTADNFLIGIVNDWLAGVSFFHAFAVEDPAEKKRMADTALQHAEMARSRYSTIDFQSPRADAFWITSPVCEYNWGLATWEFDAAKKRLLLDRAVEAGPHGLKLAEASGFIGAILLAHHAYAKALAARADIEHSVMRKKELLETALKQRQASLAITDATAPSKLWERGTMRNYLADLESQLSDLADKGARQRLLKDAIVNKQEGLALCTRYVESTKSPNLPDLASLGRRRYELGELLERQYRENEKSETLQKGADAFDASIGYFQKLAMSSRIAESYWKAAHLYDLLNDHTKASRYFSQASDNYKTAAEKNPQLEGIYLDSASYMDAWASIENARRHHDEERYLDAAQDYEKAVVTLQGTSAWSHLSSHYLGCALLEKAEAQSRAEEFQESQASSIHATQSFHEAAERLTKRIVDTGDNGESKELDDWLKVTRGREEYSLAKAVLEEAKLLDQREEKNASRMKYLEASRLFRNVASHAENVTSSKEMESLALFCDAWAKMKEAEISSSPELYDNAASLFTEAGNISAERTQRNLALANSSICKAMGLGTKFRQTREAAIYGTIKNHLETAGDYYEEAGLKKASDWTRATQKFFDSLMYMAEAERSTDKKAELYQFAEKHLDTARALYAKAGFAREESEAKKLLTRAREGRDLLSPMTALGENRIVFQGPAPASLLRDQPLGLERRPTPNIIGRVKVADTILNVGSTTTAELEMTNVGKVSAVLIGLDEIAPRGLQVSHQQLSQRDDRDWLDLNGKKLDSLKSYTVKITLACGRKGIFELHPRVVIADDRGNRGFSEFEPAALVVEEEELPGKAQANALQKLEGRGFEAPKDWFETPRGKQVIELLAREFLRDYVSKGLYAEKAGWRSLMDLVRELSIPRSAFYGRDGRDGAVLAELDRRGLLERRIFPEERGRGGAVTKVRVAYHNPSVRELVRKEIIEAL